MKRLGTRVLLAAGMGLGSCTETPVQEPETPVQETEISVQTEKKYWEFYKELMTKDCNYFKNIKRMGWESNLEMCETRGLGEGTMLCWYKSPGSNGEHRGAVWGDAGKVFKNFSQKSPSF